MFIYFRLFNFIEWVKEVMSSINQLRESEYNFNDQVFDHSMNLKIKETCNNYDRLLFKGKCWTLLSLVNVLFIYLFVLAIFRGSKDRVFRVSSYARHVSRNHNGRHEPDTDQKVHRNPSPYSLADMSTRSRTYLVADGEGRFNFESQLAQSP